ncbi:MAG: hypothetical protein HY815_26055 [Candidatus Riflebacteria bacterium]|nr:hypothetical protein [Candidatus Riflebacteria bacterium]
MPFDLTGLHVSLALWLVVFLAWLVWYLWENRQLRQFESIVSSRMAAALGQAGPAPPAIGSGPADRPNPAALDPAAIPETPEDLIPDDDLPVGLGSRLGSALGGGSDEPGRGAVKPDATRALEDMKKARAGGPSGLSRAEAKGLFGGADEDDAEESEEPPEGERAGPSGGATDEGDELTSLFNRVRRSGAGPPAAEESTEERADEPASDEAGEEGLAGLFSGGPAAGRSTGRPARTAPPEEDDLEAPSPTGRAGLDRIDAPEDADQEGDAGEAAPEGGPDSGAGARGEPPPAQPGGADVAAALGLFAGPTAPAASPEPGAGPKRGGALMSRLGKGATDSAATPASGPPARASGLMGRLASIGAPLKPSDEGVAGPPSPPGRLMDDDDQAPSQGSEQPLDPHNASALAAMFGVRPEGREAPEPDEEAATDEPSGGAPPGSEEEENELLRGLFGGQIPATLDFGTQEEQAALRAEAEATAREAGSPQQPEGPEGPQPGMDRGGQGGAPGGWPGFGPAGEAGGADGPRAGGAGAAFWPVHQESGETEYTGSSSADGSPAGGFPRIGDPASPAASTPPGAGDAPFPGFVGADGAAPPWPAAVPEEPGATPQRPGSDEGSVAPTSRQAQAGPVEAGQPAEPGSLGGAGAQESSGPPGRGQRMLERFYAFYSTVMTETEGKPSKGGKTKLDPEAAGLVFKRVMEKARKTTGGATARPPDSDGEQLLVTGQFEQAIEFYRRRLASNEAGETDRYRLGDALLKQGKTAEAVKEWEQMLALFPNGVHSFAALSELLKLNAQRRQPAGRSISFRKPQAGSVPAPVVAPAPAPDQPQAVPSDEPGDSYLAAALPEDRLAWTRTAGRFGDDDLARAIQGVEDELRAAQERWDLWEVLAYLYLRSSSLKEALEIYGHLVQSVPGDPRYRYYLGVLLARQGDRAGAGLHWQAALDIGASGLLRSRLQDQLARR